MSQSQRNIYRALMFVLWLCVYGIACANDTAPLYEIGDNVALPVASMTDCPSTLDKIQLLLDGLDTGLRPVGCDPRQKTLSFRLSPKESKVPSDAAWARILSRPWSSTDGIRTFQVTLAIPKADGSGLAQLATSSNLQLEILSRSWPLGTLLFLVAVAGLLLLGGYSGMLRDTNSRSIDLRRPYSLSRVQMAWWFALVFTACICLWVATGEWPVLGASTLALLGVSGATGVVSIGIDSSPERIVPATAGFWRDILTDAQGITLARFQMLIWNLSLGVYFLSRVVTDLQIPEFDATTLGLLGISAGAYAGLKIPEKHI